MRHRLYFHLVWTTRDRAPTITVETARFLCRFLRAVAGEERARILEIGMVRTHVHLLLTAGPQTNWPRLVQRLKGGSAHEANRSGLSSGLETLRWEAGYNLETVSPHLVHVVRRYLRTQPEHHTEERIPEWEGDMALEENLR